MINSVPQEGIKSMPDYRNTLTLGESDGKEFSFFNATKVRKSLL